MKKKLGAILLALVLALSLALPMAVAAHTEGSPFVTDLIADGGEPPGIVVGTVSVWNDGTNLNVTYEITEPGWLLVKTHLEVVESKEDFPTTKKGNPQVGHFTWSETHDPPVDTYTYTIPLADIGNGVVAGDPVYVAAHAGVVQPTDEWETVWQIGDVEIVNPGTVWLENYADEFNWEDPAGPITMGPGLNASQPAFTDPFIVGTTPTNEFPYNSNTVKNYATDFDVQWSGSLPFGGKLTVSWSPGQSANETKVVGDGISTTSFSATGTPSPGEGWFMDKYPLVEHEVSINPLSDGVHTINFQHTEGDGTFWDWVRLEKPIEQEETAWGDGTRFVEKGNWATYFTYCIQGVLWQIGTPNGPVNPIVGSAEYPADGTSDPSYHWWDGEFSYTVGSDIDPIGAPTIPGYIGSQNVLDVAGDGRPPTWTTQVLNIEFELYCDYEAGDLVLYYDRYGSEMDDVRLDVDGTNTLLGQPTATEGNFGSFSYPLPALEAGTHTISIIYMGGGSGNGHYIDYLKLVFE